METFSWNALTSFYSLIVIVIEGFMIWGSKCHQSNSQVVCDGYVKYEEAEADILVAISKKITAAAAASRVEYSKQPASARASQILGLDFNLIR